MSFDGWLKVGRIFMACWAAILLVAVTDVLSRDASPGVKALTLAELALIGLLYVTFWLALVGTARQNSTAIVLVTMSAILGLVLVTEPRQWVNFIVLPILVAGAAYSWRPAAAIIATLTVAGAVILLARHNSFTDFVGTEFGVLLVGVAAIGGRLFVGGYRELQAAREELARLAVSEERARLARDLHDQLGQELALVVLNAELVAADLPDGTTTHNRVVDIIARSREAMTSLRELVSGYRQPILASEVSSVESAFRSAGIEFTYSGPVDGIPARIASTLAWVVREGATNVIRHSGACRCWITISTDRNVATLTIEDDGRGSDQPGSPQALTGIRERAASVGGKLTAGNRPAGGFLLTVEIPTD